METARSSETYVTNCHSPLRNPRRLCVRNKPVLNWIEYVYNRNFCQKFCNAPGFLFWCRTYFERTYVRTTHYCVWSNVIWMRINLYLRVVMVDWIYKRTVWRSGQWWRLHSHCQQSGLHLTTCRKMKVETWKKRVFDGSDFNIFF